MTIRSFRVPPAGLHADLEGSEAPGLKREVQLAGVHGNFGRFPDAKDYALAALRNYEPYGEGAKDDVLKTLKLIAYIDNAMKPGP